MSHIFLCAIAKNEHDYIEEWVKYHLALGVNHIFLYDNEDVSTLDTLPCLSPYRSQLTIKHFPGFAKQFDAYNDCLSLPETRNYRWGGFIDIDEFVLLKKHANIVDFLTEHCPVGILSLNWVMFSGQANPTIDVDVNDIKIPVCKRFTMRNVKVDQHVKCLFNRDCVAQIHNPHYPWTFDVQKYAFVEAGKVELKSEIKKTENSHHLPWPYELHLKCPKTLKMDTYPLMQYDTSGRCTYGPFNENGPTDIAQINHYYYKSKGEYSKKYGSIGSDGARKQVTWPSDETHLKEYCFEDVLAKNFYETFVEGKIEKVKDKQILKLYIVAHNQKSAEQANQLVKDHYPYGEVLILPHGEESPYFESDVFKMLDERGIDRTSFQYIGIITYSYVKKMGPINLLQEVKDLLDEGNDPDVISLLNLNFFKPRVNRPVSYIESISMQHGPFMWNIIQKMFEGKQILDKNIQGFFSNWFIAKPCWLEKYTKFYIKARELLENDRELSAWVKEDSYYIGSKTMSDQQLVKIFGKPQYGLQPFIFERLPPIFFHIEGAKVMRAKNPKPILWNLYD